MYNVLHVYAVYVTATFFFISMVSSSLGRFNFEILSDFEENHQHASKIVHISIWFSLKCASNDKNINLN